MDNVDYRTANVEQAGGQAAALAAESCRKLHQEALPPQPGHAGICRAPADPNSLEAKQWGDASRATQHEPLQVNSDGRYIVKDKDCLSTIAVRALHDANKPVNPKSIADEVEQIRQLNQDCYPSLAGCDNVKTGWQLKVHGCHHAERDQPAPPAVPVQKPYGAADNVPLPPRRPNFQTAPDDVPEQNGLYRRSAQPLPVPDITPQYRAAQQDEYAPQYRPLPDADTPQYRQPVVEQNPLAALGQVLGPLAGIAASFAGGFAGGAMFGDRDRYWHHHHYNRGPWGYERDPWDYNRGYGYDAGNWNQSQFYPQPSVQPFFIGPSYNNNRYGWRHHGRF